MQKRSHRISAAALALFCACTATAARAQGFLEGVQQGVNDTAGQAEFPTARLPVVIGGIIGVALSLLSALLLGFLLYAGFLWMTAAGDKDKVETAKKIIRNAIIGLVITVASYAIANFVMDRLAYIGD